MLRTLARISLLACLPVLAAPAMAEDQVRLKCTPREFQVVPGEPMRLQLTVQTDSATPFRLDIPNEPRLKLRAVEKRPVRRLGDGVVIYERVIVWQGLEPGTVKIDTLSVLAQEEKRLFPEVTITIRDPAP
jgi:hypothetical protein